MAGSIDRRRAGDLLARHHLDALVLSEPEAFRYVTGAWAGPASLFRRAGAAFVVIPREPETPLGAVVSDFDAERIGRAAPGLLLRTHPAWIETVWLDRAPASDPIGKRIEAATRALGRPAEFARPATFDLELSLAALDDLLQTLGIADGRLGFDLDFVPAADFAAIVARMPRHSIANGSPVVDRLRAVKSEGEIELLQRGIAFSEQGYRRMMDEGRIGMRPPELISLYRAGVRDAAAESDFDVSTAEYLTLGASPRTARDAAEPGDPLKADMVCGVDGYQADMSRNFVFGRPSADQARLHEIAQEAFEAGLDMMRPGRTLSEVHRAASESLARSGLKSYRRGHFGHGVGLSVFSEQWPYIAADSDVEIEPNMVLAYEIPLYIDGLASFNLEDQILITSGDPVSMNRLPRRLLTLG